MDANPSWEDLARRLTALVVKIDERDTQHAERLERIETWIERQDGLNERLTAAIERLSLLMTRVFETGENGH